MCDALSLASAGGDALGGFAQSIDAKSRANLEVAQMDAMRTLAVARASDKQSGLHEQFAESQRQNLAAMAVSGIAAGSFSAVAKGNRKNLQKGLAKVSRNVDAETDQLSIEMQEAALRGRQSSRAALLGGFTAAAGTLYDAEKAYQRNKMPKADGSAETRRDTFFKSIGR